jgi:hypothetical protein
MRRAMIVVGVLLAALAVEAGNVDMVLRVEPEIGLVGSERVYVGPIILEPNDGQDNQGLDLVASREFERYLRRLLRRETRLTVIKPIPDLRPPTEDPVALLAQRDFWLELGKQTEADILVTASVDIEVLDRAGYQTEEYVSPTDGKTYFRQVLIEETGFNYDILLVVFDARTGNEIHREQITDFQERPERKLEVFKDMFNDLYTLENRLLGVFVPRYVRAKRFLYR